MAGVEIDSPWLLEGDNRLLVNGVDVVPQVDAALNERFPGRELRVAEEPAGLAEAWLALERTWAATTERARAMPPGSLEASVGGEWSFTQTLRHLVMATDTWLGRAILERDQPYHPAGLPDGSSSGVYDDADFSPDPPTVTEVLQARADRQRMVRDFIAGLTPDLLAEGRRNPHDPAYPETVLSCLRTILEEEWEHHGMPSATWTRLLRRTSLDEAFSRDLAYVLDGGIHLDRDATVTDRQRPAPHAASTTSHAVQHLACPGEDADLGPRADRPRHRAVPGPVRRPGPCGRMQFTRVA